MPGLARIDARPPGLGLAAGRYPAYYIIPNAYKVFGYQKYEEGGHILDSSYSDAKLNS
jgi:hypothetical protein